MRASISPRQPSNSLILASISRSREGESPSFPSFGPLLLIFMAMVAFTISAIERMRKEQNLLRAAQTAYVSQIASFDHVFGVRVSPRRRLCLPGRDAQCDVLKLKRASQAKHQAILGL